MTDSAGERWPTRRETLAAVGGLVGYPDALPARGTRDTRQSAAADDRAPAREDFLWVSPQRSRLQENMLALAERADLTVFLRPPQSTRPGVGEAVRPALAAASDRGLRAGINLGLLRETTPKRFLSDPAARERHLDGLREVAGVFDDLFDGGRIVLWQEAPVMGRWVESGAWNWAAVENLLRFGPAVFEAQKTAIQSVNPDVDVGVFVHFPYVVDSKRPAVFADLAEKLDERGVTPEFGFADFYRGWYEKDVGPERADAAVRSLVSNVGDHLGGRDVFYLGQAHTIDPGHTPSKDVIQSTVRTALDAGAAGVGWYLASHYKPTTVGFDPFVPNASDATPDGGPVSTATVARDRFQYALATTLAQRADVAPADRFDLWFHGEAVAFYDHRISARTADGEWTLLGDIGGYLDGDYPYARGRTPILRALDRARVAPDGTAELRIQTAEGAEPTTLDSVRAMPWDPDAFVTEPRATALIEGGASVETHELGGVGRPTVLSPGGTTRLSVPVGDRSPTLVPLLYPDHTDAVRQLRAAEADSGIDPDERFDLWVVGSGLADPNAAPPIRTAAGEPVDPSSACLAAVSTDETALYYGLDRDRFLPNGIEVGDSSGRVDAAYAMPYAGSTAFRTPSEASTLVDSQPDAVATFALATIVGPL